MLTDREIEAAYARMRDRIDLVNAEYLKAVARQINAIGGLNASSIRKLAQMRIYRANVVKIKAALAKALNLSVQELQELLERAAREVYADAEYMAVIRGRRLMQLEYNEPLKKYISAVSAQTEERFHNYSNTTCIDENYQEAVTNAIDAVARGVTDYRSAIRDTMRKLGGDGLRITYESGVTRRMDTALRQNVLDGVKQIQQEAQRLIGEEIGATGVELSAHPFSAVDHEPAQGRQFSLQEFSRMQAGQPFTDANGNRYDGFKRPIGEWNCRHFASYIILGVSPRRYTDAQLKAWKEMNHKGCTIGGKHYTVYEASQLMRQLETSVRRQKDIANLAKLSGDDKLRREAQAKIVTLKAQYKAVSEASGLKQRAERMVVEGYGRKEAAAASRVPSGSTKPTADVSTVPNVSENAIENKPQLIQGFVSGEKGSAKSAFTKAEERGTIALTSEEEYAVSKYVGKDSYIVNESLRSGEPLSSDEQQFVSNLDKALEKVPTYTGTVHRSLSSQAMRDPEGFWERYTPGNKVLEAAYTSTSTEIYDDTMDIQMIIQCKNGRDLRAYNPSEQEILFQRGTWFLVEKREGNTIWLTEI